MYESLPKEKKEKEEILYANALTNYTEILVWKTKNISPLQGFSYDEYNKSKVNIVATRELFNGTDEENCVHVKGSHIMYIDKSTKQRFCKTFQIGNIYYNPYNAS